VSRVDKLREDNPDKALMRELTGGMKVHRPEGFKPNGNLPRTPLRATYVAVAPAVNRMLGDRFEAFRSMDFHPPREFPHEGFRPTFM
jgi:hypothetical protein